VRQTNSLARAKKISIGVTAALPSYKTPNALFVGLWNENTDDVGKPSKPIGQGGNP
jgi:hypothetical protein